MKPGLCSLCNNYVPRNGSTGTCFWTWDRDEENIAASGIPVCIDNNQFTPDPRVPLATVMEAVAFQE